MNLKAILLTWLLLLAGLICIESKKVSLTRVVTLNKLEFVITNDYVLTKGDTMNVIIHIESDFKSDFTAVFYFHL